MYPTWVYKYFSHEYSFIDVLYNDIKKLGTNIRKNERTNERKKSHIEVAAPPKNTDAGDIFLHCKFFFIK